MNCINFLDSSRQALFDSLSVILGLTEQQAEAMLRFAPAYQVGSVAFPPTDSQDLCMIQLGTDPELGACTIRSENNVSDDGERLLRIELLHVGIEAKFTLYGDNALSNAYKIYSGIHLQPAVTILRNADMAALPHGSPPQWAPESHSANWVPHVQLILQFYMVVYIRTVEEEATSFSDPQIIIS